jgi:hypothetical protein
MKLFDGSGGFRGFRIIIPNQLIDIAMLLKVRNLTGVQGHY